mgnify:CR=1 FL=1
MKEPDVVIAMAALAQPHRLQIFRDLVVAGHAGSTPSEIGLSLDLAPATLSFHLKELMNAGLISQERQGRNLIYRAEFATINQVLAYLTQNCCGGQAVCFEEKAQSCAC